MGMRVEKERERERERQREREREMYSCEPSRITHIYLYIIIEGYIETRGMRVFKLQSSPITVKHCLHINFSTNEIISVLYPEGGLLPIK